MYWMTPAGMEIVFGHDGASMPPPYRMPNRCHRPTLGWLGQPAPIDASFRVERKRQFALQFKTRPCQTWEAHGACHYAGKCYFAHGAGDVRTMEMNEADGLTSDAAIRTWLRAHAQATPAAAAAAGDGEAAFIGEMAMEKSYSGSRTPVGDADGTPMQHPAFADRDVMSSMEASDMDMTPPRTPPRRAEPMCFRHHPYSMICAKIILRR